MINSDNVKKISHTFSLTARFLSRFCLNELLKDIPWRKTFARVAILKNKRCLTVKESSNPNYLLNKNWNKITPNEKNEVKWHLCFLSIHLYLKKWNVLIIPSRNNTRKLWHQRTCLHKFLIYRRANEMTWRFSTRNKMLMLMNQKGNYIMR